MLEAKRVLESRKMVHECWISRCATLPDGVFQDVVSFFEGLGRGFIGGHPYEIQREKVAASVAQPEPLDASSQAAQYSLKQFFYTENRINRSPPKNKVH